MKHLLAGLLAISLMGIGSSVMADDGSGFVLDDGGVQAQVVTVTVPLSAFRGDIVDIDVSYPSVDPTKVRCFLILPTNDPATYVSELKVFNRESNLATTGAVCPFYIPTFIQIEGTAIAFVTVGGQGSGFATFDIFP